MLSISKIKVSYFLAFIAILLFSFSILNGCDDSGNVLTPTSDSGVVHFDSIVVQEKFGNNSCGINLYNGTTVLRDSASKDAELSDSNSTGYNFFLNSGGAYLDQLSALGYITRFNRIYSSMTKAQFDTVTVIPAGILDSTDFTEFNTHADGAWGYFNAPMNLTDSKPVYSFWLKQKSSDFIGRNIYGIIIPRVAIDDTPGVVGGFRMSFEVRINTKGYNYFKHSTH